MSEYRETSDREIRTEDKIDITNLLLDFLYAVKKLWWLVVALTVIFSGYSYFSVSRSYVPNYVASATCSVSSLTGSSAGDMAKVFPYFLTSGVLADVIAEDLEVEALPGTIDVQADEGTNLLTISVTAGDPQVAYNMLVSVMENYPEVAKFVVGETKIVVLDETGVPTDTGREVVVRGSYKRGALKGCLLGMAILCLYALTRRTVKSKKELKKKLNLTDYGSIPYIREKKRKKETFNNTLSLLNSRLSQGYLEAIRKLRIKIMNAMEEKDYKTLLVTSSIPGEGKTTVAANLAISMAQQGKKVILIDCDMRNPSVAKVMNDQEKHPGLGLALEKKVLLKEAISTVEVSGGGLRVLYGSEEDDENTKLFGSPAMRLMIRALEKQADIVILDTAPAGILADAPIIARYADAALYVIRYDHTKLRHIRSGISALSMSGVDILGYVFNGDASGKGRAYGYGYGYGKHYGAHGRYGAYGSYTNGKVGTTDEYGRVIKE